MFGLTIILVIAIKIFMPNPEKNSAIEHAFWMNKTFPSQKYNIVVGGDSRTYRGISIDAIEAEVKGDLQGINLGYASMGFNAEYLDFLASNLSSDGQKIIVLALSPHSLTDEAVKNEKYLEYKEKGKFEQIKARYFTQFSKHFAIYKPSNLVEEFIHSNQGDVYYQEYTPKGWAKSYRFPEDSLTALSIYTNIFSKYQVNPKLVDTLYLKVEEFKQNGITVVAFRIPTFTQLNELENKVSGFNEDDLKQEMESRGCTWIDLNPAEFHTYDGSHLHYKSAEKLSKIIGEKINKIIRAD